MYLRYVSGLLAVSFLAIAGFVLNTPTNTHVGPIQKPESITFPSAASSAPATTAASNTASETLETKNITLTTAANDSVTAKTEKAASLTPQSSTVATSTIEITAIQSASTSASIATAASVVDFATEVEQQIHALVNAKRSSSGLSALLYSTEVAAIARAHSRDMLENKYFSHESKTGCGMSCRFQAAGYSYWAIGENIYTMNGFELSATETARHIVDGWINSPGHLANILNNTFTTEGVGVVQFGESLYATENFAKPR